MLREESSGFQHDVDGATLYNTITSDKDQSEAGGGAIGAILSDGFDIGVWEEKMLREASSGFQGDVTSDEDQGEAGDWGADDGVGYDVDEFFNSSNSSE